MFQLLARSAGMSTWSQWPTKKHTLNDCLWFYVDGRWGRAGSEFWIVCWWYLEEFLVLRLWVWDTVSLSSVTLLPRVSEEPASPFFPKRNLLPYGFIFSWAGSWVEPRGKQPSVPAGAAWRQLLFRHIPGCRGCPELLPGLLTTLTWVTGFPLPGETGGSYVCLVPFHLSAFLMVTRACLTLVPTNQGE